MVDVADDVALAESRLVARPLVEPHVTQGHRRDAIVVHDQARLCAWSASLGVTHALAVTSSAVRTAFSVMACSAGRRRSRAVIPNPRKAACTLTASRGSTERTHPSTQHTGSRTRVEVLRGAAPLGGQVPGARTGLGRVRPEGCAAHVPGGAPEVQVHQRRALRGLQQLADNDLQRPPAAGRRPSFFHASRSERAS